MKLAPVVRLLLVLGIAAPLAAAAAPSVLSDTRDEVAAPMSEEDAIRGWRALLDSLAGADRFSGAVLLAKDGRPLLQQAYGQASRSAGVPNRLDTRFNLGSINKLFTKLAIAQLVERGKVRLDDTVDRYLPDYPLEVARRVTVRHLLEHRGGIGDIFGEPYDRADRSQLRRVSDWIPLFRDQPLAFEPGERQEYSNGGYVLLGAIVERASGEDYYDYVRRHIYRPLGMKDTDHFASDGKTANLATGYTRRVGGAGRDPVGWADNAPTRPWRGSPAGGGYSTLGDLLRFVQAMRGSRLLKSETVAPEFREFRADEHGNLGLGVGGGAPGINAAVEAIGPYTIVVLANLDPPAAQVPASWLAERLPGAAGRGERRMIRMGGGADHGGSPAGGIERRVIGGPGGEADASHRREIPQRSHVPPAGVEVEMLEAGHLPAVRVMVNGQGPYLFGLDTGAQGAARIDSALAAKLGLEVVGQARSGDPSGLNARTVDLVRVESLEIGGARFEGMVAGVRGDRERRLGLTLDGILGFGLFADALLTLDYPARKVRIERGELPAADGRDVIGFTMDRGIPSISLQVDSIAVEAHVDAGSMGGFSLPADLKGRLKLASEPRVVGRARTVSNEFEIEAAQLAGSVRLGGHEFEDPTLEFQPVFPTANVGSRVLRNFAVTFDQKRLRMRLLRGT